MIDYKMYVFRIGRFRKWIPRLETQLMSGDTSCINDNHELYDDHLFYGYNAWFEKNKEPKLCPHCGDVIPFDTWPNMECVMLDDGHSSRVLSEGLDSTLAWKALVERYLESVNMTIEELELKLSIAGF